MYVPSLWVAIPLHLERRNCRVDCENPCDSRRMYVCLTPMPAVRHVNRALAAGRWSRAVRHGNLVGKPTGSKREALLTPLTRTRRDVRPA